MTTRLVEPASDQAPPLVYRVGEVARLLQLSEATVYRRIDSGGIPAVPGVGRSKRVPRWWVDEALGRVA